MRKLYIFMRAAFVFFLLVCFYLLSISRSGEVHTVWEFLPPVFAPVFLATTVMLAVSVLSSETTRLKIVFVILYSFLVRSFSAIVFPAGVVGFQQAVLGVSRSIYDNAVFHGVGGSVPNVVTRVFNWFNAKNFQSVYSVTFARMLGVDVMWTHLFLVPVLWAVFVPCVAFLITRRLFSDDKVAVLSGLLSSAFPFLVSWGTISVPNSLSCVFFFASLYFSVSYLSSGKNSALYLLVFFVVVSFMAHPLSGTVSLAFAVLAFTLRIYRRERVVSAASGKVMLLVSLVFSIGLLPFALVFLRFFSPSYAYFGLDKISDLPLMDIVGLFIFGEYWNYEPVFALLQIIGPILGVVGLVYVSLKSRGRTSVFDRQHVLFFFLGVVIVLVDYRILKLFMVRVPFDEGRLYVFRDLTLLAFAAFVINRFVSFLVDGAEGVVGLARRTANSGFKMLSGGLIVLMISGLVLASVFFGGVYPYSSPLQITWYEIEAVKFVDSNAGESYVVIGDQYISLTGIMYVGVFNPRAYYFQLDDPRGSRLFQDMRTEVSNDVMLRAMEVTNASLVFFVLQQARWPAEYEGVVEKAGANNVTTFRVFYDSSGLEKLRVFYFVKS